MAEVQLVKKGTVVTHRAGTSERSPECRVCVFGFNIGENGQ